MADLKIIANLSVAIGTLILAIVTYLHVRSSDKQLKLLQKSTERPIVLELLHDVLNTIQSELKREIEVISRKEVLWLSFKGDSEIYNFPMVFPVSSKRDFHLDILVRFDRPFLNNNENLKQKITEIGTFLDGRYGLYMEISEHLQYIEQIIEEYGVDLIINKLFLKDISLELKPQNGGNSFELFRGKKDFIGEITQEKLNSIVICMMISSLFKPLEENDDIIGRLGYSQLTKEFIPHIGCIIDLFPKDKFSILMTDIYRLLEETKDYDDAILRETENLKNIFRDIYNFTDNEINPYFGFF